MMPALLALFLASCSSLAAGTEALDSATVEVNIGPMAGGPGAISAAEAAEMAVLNAPGLRAERESIALRDGAWKLGFRAFMPTLELGAGSDERLALHGPDSFTKTLSVSVGQPVWDGGRLHATRMLEASELALAKAELERAVRNTAEAAVTAYRSVVAARLRLGIERASLESTEAERDILATEVSLGLAKPSDLLEADMSLSDQRLRSAESELALAIACSELAEALGVGILPELSESPGRERAGLPLDEPRLISAVVERSPELEAAFTGSVPRQRPPQAPGCQQSASKPAGNSAVRDFP
jgi:outer membrane protein TolC